MLDNLIEIKSTLISHRRIGFKGNHMDNRQEYALDIPCHNLKSLADPM